LINVIVKCRIIRTVNTVAPFSSKHFSHNTQTQSIAIVMKILTKWLYTMNNIVWNVSLISIKRCWGVYNSIEKREPLFEWFGTLQYFILFAIEWVGNNIQSLVCLDFHSNHWKSRIEKVEQILHLKRLKSNDNYLIQYRQFQSNYRWWSQIYEIICRDGKEEHSFNNRFSLFWFQLSSFHSSK
jgi:hypothetical protein